MAKLATAEQPWLDDPVVESRPTQKRATAEQPWLDDPVVESVPAIGRQEGGFAMPSLGLVGIGTLATKAPAFLAGASKGVGDVMFGAQRLLGKGLRVVGLDEAGNRLIEDAEGRIRVEEAKLAPYKEAQPFAAGAGEVGGQIIATAPVGGALGAAVKGVGKVAPAVAKFTTPVAESLSTGGMSAGGATGVWNPLVRAAGGAVTGGASAALIDPTLESAGTGAAIGGVLGGTVGAGSLLKQLVTKAPAPTASAAVKKAVEAGYVVPPSQAGGSATGSLLEGVGGKLKLAQQASERNQVITNQKAARAIGLSDDIDITPDAIDTVRKQAGRAYDDVSRLGKFDVTRADLPSSVEVVESVSPLMGGKTKSVDAGELVRAWKQANADSRAYYQAYARDANPETLAKAKAAENASKKIDSFLEQQLRDTGNSELLGNLKEARKLIAKTYTVEKAFNPATGSVDATKLAKELAKGKPLSGELKEVAEFASNFPKVAKPPAGIGGVPASSPLDLYAGLGIGSLIDPITAGAVLGGRPLARNIALSPMVQKRLGQQATGAGNYLTRTLQGGARVAPIAATSPNEDQRR